MLSRQYLTWSILIFLLMLLSSNSLPQTGEENIIELVYDDGEPNLKLAFIENAGLHFVTRFSPPATPARLLKAKYFLADTSYGTSARFEVMEDSNNEPAIHVFGPVAISGGKLGWNELDFSFPLLFVNRDFYLMFSYDNQSKFTIGAENHPPLSYRTYDCDCCGWWVWEDVDLLLRAVVSVNSTAVARNTIDSNPDHLPCLRNYPNPFNSTTTLHYQTTTAAPVTLVIFDLTGQELLTLTSRFHRAGNHSVVWNGRDSIGRDVPSGIYFCHLQDGSGVVRVHKMALVR